MLLVAALSYIVRLPYSSTITLPISPLHASNVDSNRIFSWITVPNSDHHCQRWGKQERRRKEEKKKEIKKNKARKKEPLNSYLLVNSVQNKFHWVVDLFIGCGYSKSYWGFIFHNVITIRSCKLEYIFGSALDLNLNWIKSFYSNTNLSFISSFYLIAKFLMSN